MHDAGTTDEPESRSPTTRRTDPAHWLLGDVSLSRSVPFAQSAASGFALSLFEIGINAFAALHHHAHRSGAQARGPAGDDDCAFLRSLCIPFM